MAPTQPGRTRRLAGDQTGRFRAVTAAQAPPRHWEADVLLRDGGTAHIRPIRPEDREVFVEFYSRVSDQSKYYLSLIHI